jgi:hypothetical protein
MAMPLALAKQFGKNKAKQNKPATKKSTSGKQNGRKK